MKLQNKKPLNSGFKTKNPIWIKFKNFGTALSMALALSFSNGASFAQESLIGGIDKEDNILEDAQDSKLLKTLKDDIVEYASLTTSYDVEEYDFDGDVDRFNSDVIDVTVLNSSLAVVVFRPESNPSKVKMLSVRINSNGTLSILKTYTYTGNVWGLRVEKVKYNRICVISSHASLSTGLSLKVYEVNTSTGSFSYKSKATAGYTADVEAAVMFTGSTSRIVTSVRTYEGDVKHIVWNIDSSGKVSRAGSAVTSNSTVPGIVAVSSSKIVTGVRSSNGNLKLQLWQLSSVSGKITPVLKDTETRSEDASDIGLTKLTTTRFAVIMKRSDFNNNQTSMVWDLTGSGNNNLTYRDYYSVTNTTQVDAATAISGSAGRFLTAGSRYSGTHEDKMYLNAFDVTSSGTISREDWHHGEKINQIRLKNLTSSRFITAYTRKSDSRLIITAWDIPASGPDVITNTEGLKSVDVSFGLEQSFPNPANGVVNIPFNLKEAGKVNLELFNLTGQKVATIFSGEAKAGRSVKEFNTSNIPTGIYVYKLTSLNGTYIKKMQVSK